MPIRELNIPDITQDVHKPVVLGIIKDLYGLEIMPKPRKLRYHEVVKSAKVPARDNAGYVTDPHPHRSKLLGDDVLLVEVEREPLEFPGFSVKPGFHRGTPIIEDHSTGLSASVIFDIVKCKTTMIYQSSSRGRVVGIANAVRNKIYTGREVNLHDVEFNLALPELVDSFIHLYHSYRENVEGYGDSINEYYQKIANLNMIAVTDIVKKNQQLRWTQKQLQVEGRYTDEAPEISDNEDGSYTVEIGYEFTYNEPLMYQLRYGLIVHNQLLPYKLIAPNTRLEKTAGTNHLVGAIRDGHDTTRILYEPKGTVYPVVSPPVDQYRVPTEVAAYMPLIQALCIIGENKKDVIDLNALGTDIIYDKIKEYLDKKGKEEILHAYRGIFHVKLFTESGVIFDYRALEVSNKLILKSKKELDLRDNHRVVLYVAYDFNAMSDDSIERLIKHPELMRSICHIAHKKRLIGDLLHTAVVGAYVGEGASRTWIPGVTTLRGFRFLYRVLLDADVSKLVMRTTPYNVKSDRFDSVFTETSIVEATGGANTLNARTVMQAYLETSAT